VSKFAPKCEVNNRPLAAWSILLLKNVEKIFIRKGKKNEEMLDITWTSGVAFFLTKKQSQFF
jgi:hypothetical protein